MTKSASGKSTLTFIHLLVLFLCSGLAFAVEPTVTSCGECVGALKSDGTVWVWGKNDEPGLLGLGKQREALFPTRIPSLDRVRSLSMNSNHFLVAREDGSVWWWGESRCLGKSRVPVRIEKVTNAVQVVAGVYDVALLGDGRVVAWGRNIQKDLASNETGECVKKPTPIRNLPKISTLVHSQGSVYGGIDAQRHLWIWGNLTFGGIPWKPHTPYSGPDVVAGLDSVVSATIFGEIGLALRSDGSLWGWTSGTDEYLMLGHAEYDQKPVQLIAGPSGFRAVILASGPSALALKEDGSLWAWGKDASGLFGTRQGPFSTPFQNPHLSEITRVWESWGRAFAEKKDGTLWTWGGDWIADRETETVELRNPPGGMEIPQMIKTQDGRPFRLRD